MGWTRLTNDDGPPTTDDRPSEMDGGRRAPETDGGRRAPETNDERRGTTDDGPPTTGDWGLFACGGVPDLHRGLV